MLSVKNLPVLKAEFRVDVRNLIKQFRSDVEDTQQEVTARKMMRAINTFYDVPPDQVDDQNLSDLNRLDCTEQKLEDELVEAVMRMIAR